MFAIKNSTRIRNVFTQIKIRHTSTVEDGTHTIKDMYKITSKKMPSPNIRNLIDSSRFVNPNVKLGLFTTDRLNQDYFVDKKHIPISAKLGPFEVKIKLNPNRSLTLS